MGLGGMPLANGTAEAKTEKVPFLMLGLDLPPAPLYKDKDKKDIIPQVCFPNVKTTAWFCSLRDCSTDLVSVAETLCRC